MAGIKDRLDFSGKVALVTGASGGRGLGSAIARSFHELGAAIVNLDIADGTGLFPTRYLYLAGDATDEEAVRAALGQTAAAFGRLDVLVNNVGIISKSPMDLFDMSLFRQVLEVNIVSTALVTKHSLELLKKSGSGRIINIASVQAHIGTATYSAYSASKAAICGLTRVWAKELLPFGLTVNSICPGFAYTEMFERGMEKLVIEAGLTREEAMAEIVKDCPQKRPLQPREVGELAVFLGSELAAGLTGQSIHLDGGMVMA